MIKIPKSFKLFATTINVVFDNKLMDAIKSFGAWNYSASTITLATIDGIDEMSDDKRMDTFYHEKVHAILDLMRERELNENEKFVDVFAKLLRQSDETAQY